MVEASTLSPFGEEDVGISLFLGDLEQTKEKLIQLKCTFKHRYSDFIVNEIDEKGEVVWFKPETDLQKWKKVNIEQTLPQVLDQGNFDHEEDLKEGDKLEESKGDGMTPYPEVMKQLETEIF